VLRWRIDARRQGGLRRRSRGDRRPRPLYPAHDFDVEARSTRDDQVHGKHPHVSILDTVFVETVGGDLTIKVEDNTETGRGIYSEPVDDANQSLDDGEILLAPTRKVGALIVLKHQAVPREAWRYLVYNTRRSTVVRIDAIEQAVWRCPKTRASSFPGLLPRDGGVQALRRRRRADEPSSAWCARPTARTCCTSSSAPPTVGTCCTRTTSSEGGGRAHRVPRVLPLRRRHAHRVSRGPDEEPTRVHPMQVWRTPFTSAEFAASAPVTASFLAKVGNPDLVRGISDALSLRRTGLSEAPSRQTWEDLIAAARRMVDAYHWLGNAECFELLPAVKELCTVSEQIIDEYEKVEAIRRRAAEALAGAETTPEGAAPRSDPKTTTAPRPSWTPCRPCGGSAVCSAPCASCATWTSPASAPLRPRWTPASAS
jgi:hypothetical protein